MWSQAREPLVILHSVLSEIAQHFVLLEVHTWASHSLMLLSKALSFFALSSGV